MPNYNWVCQACDQINPPGSTACFRCECPANATGYEIDQYKKIASNISGPHTPVDSIPVKATEVEPYFAVSTTKLVLLSLCTFNWYQVYWFYKNWQVIKNYTPGSELMPFWRAIFYGLWAYFCFREIRSAAHNIEKYKNLPVGLLAIGILVLSACQKLTLPYNILWALIVLPIIPVNNMAIAVNQLHDPNYTINDEFSTWNKVAVWVGAFLWLMILLRIKIYMSRHS